MSEKMAALLNEQINKELYSAYLYWDMSRFLETQGLDGFAHWFMVQAKEELEHAQRIYRFLIDNEVDVELATVLKPSCDYESVMDVMCVTREHEEQVTESIHQIYMEANDENDLRTKNFLEWFVQEQTEEEVTARNMIEKMKVFGKDAKGLYLLNWEFGKRSTE